MNSIDDQNRLPPEKPVARRASQREGANGMFQGSLGERIEGVGASKMTNAPLAGTDAPLKFLRTAFFLKII